MGRTLPNSIRLITDGLTVVGNGEAGGFNGGEEFFKMKLSQRTNLTPVMILALTASLVGCGKGGKEASPGDPSLAAETAPLSSSDEHSDDGGSEFIGKAASDPYMAQRIAYRQQCGIPSDLQLPDVRQRTGTSNGWTMIQDFGANSLCLVSVRTLEAELWKWAGNGSTCYYLFRHDENLSFTNNGLLCFKDDSCEACAFDSSGGKRATSWNDLQFPGDKTFKDGKQVEELEACSDCHIHKYVAPREKSYQVAEVEEWIKPWKSCANDTLTGTKWIVPPNSPSTANRFVSGTGNKCNVPKTCASCHGQKWIQPKYPKDYCSTVFSPAFDNDGSMSKIGPNFTDQWKKIPREECTEYLDCLGCNNNTRTLERICDSTKTTFDLTVIGSGVVLWTEGDDQKECSNKSAQSKSCKVTYNDVYPTMTFTATPLKSPEWSFSGWSGKKSGLATTITLSRDKLKSDPQFLNAYFSRSGSYAVNVTPVTTSELPSVPIGLVRIIPQSGLTFTGTGKSECSGRVTDANPTCTVIHRAGMKLAAVELVPSRAKFQRWRITSGKTSQFSTDVILNVDRGWSGGPIPFGANIVAEFVEVRRIDVAGLLPRKGNSAVVFSVNNGTGRRTERWPAVTGDMYELPIKVTADEPLIWSFYNASGAKVAANMCGNGNFLCNVPKSIPPEITKLRFTRIDPTCEITGERYSIYGGTFTYTVNVNPAQGSANSIMTVSPFGTAIGVESFESGQHLWRVNFPERRQKYTLIYDYILADGRSTQCSLEVGANTAPPTTGGTTTGNVTTTGGTTTGNVTTTGGTTTGTTGPGTTTGATTTGNVTTTGGTGNEGNCIPRGSSASCPAGSSPNEDLCCANGTAPSPLGN